MATEYDDLDDLLDDDELQASILAKSPALPGSSESKQPDISKLGLEDNNQKAKGSATEASHGKEAGPDKKPEAPQEKAAPLNETGLESLLASFENGEGDSALRSLLSQLNETPDVENDAAPDTGSFEDTISATIDRLQKSQKPGSSDANDTDLLAQLLQELQSPEGPSANGFDGILGNLIQELATKEVLYPPLKEMHENYPNWFKKHEASLDPKELERLKKQQSIIAAVVAKYESPDYSDDNGSHREFITEKMAEMQETGAPPEELTEDVAGGGFPGMGMGAKGPPDLPSDCTTQ